MQSMIFLAFILFYVYDNAYSLWNPQIQTYQKIWILWKNSVVVWHSNLLTNPKDQQRVPEPLV